MDAYILLHLVLDFSQNVHWYYRQCKLRDFFDLVLDFSQNVHWWQMQFCHCGYSSEKSEFVDKLRLFVMPVKGL